MTDLYDYIVIGDGVAARCVLWHLAQSTKFQESKILQISSDSFFPPCTTSTTSIVSLDVHESGISKLGDILVSSTKYFQEFVDENKPSGVFKTKQFYIAPEEQDSKYLDFISRYGEVNKIFDVSCAKKDAYILDSKIYSDWLKVIYSSKLSSFDFLDDVVTSVSNTSKQVIFKSGKSLHASRRVICCTGAFTSLLNSESRSKSVSGSYLEFKDVSDLGESFILSSGHSNIIYRKHDRKILFGGSSFNGLCFLADSKALRDSYTVFKEAFNTLALPEFNDGIISTGIRHKGVKRMPHLDIGHNVIWLDSLYKNGFTFSAFFANEIKSNL